MRVSSIQLPFRAGMRVYDKTDPRHIGQVIAIFNTLSARVKWDNGWKSDLPTSCLARAEYEQ